MGSEYLHSQVCFGSGVLSRLLPGFQFFLHNNLGFINPILIGGGKLCKQIIYKRCNSYKNQQKWHFSQITLQFLYFKSVLKLYL